MTAVRVAGRLDRDFAWDGESLQVAEARDAAPWPPRALRGAAGRVEQHDGGWRILRDPLGINKLFWVPEGEHSIAIAARPRVLLEQGNRLEDVRAIAPGSAIEIGEGETQVASIVPEQWFSDADEADAAGGVERAGSGIRLALDAYLAAIRRAFPDAEAFACLSGGLDSSGITALVRRHFPGAAAVSFDLEHRGGGPSADREAARSLAGELDMPLIEVDVTEDELLEPIDAVLAEGVDWRDFNVHAALVNAALAARIAESRERRDAIVFTGDLANEFLADYHAEVYRGTTYYRLPDVSPLQLRSSLVRGLDTSHREVGVFAAWGLDVVQPYAVAVDHYLALPASLLAHEDRKEVLCRAVFGELVPEYVYARPKARAQIGGGNSGGVLAACVDRGIDADWLRRRFAIIHGVEDARTLDRFIRGGRYRAATPAGGER